MPRYSTLPIGQTTRALSVFEVWRASFRLRPLLWIAACIVGGGACGFQLAGWLEPLSFAQRAPFFYSLLFAASAFLVLSLFWRGRRSLFSRIALGAFCFIGMSAHAALRVLPAQDDVSHLANENSSRRAPLQARVVTLRGFVADYPRRGEFTTEFPLQCVERDDDQFKRLGLVAKGFVWVSVEPNAPLEVGDAVEVTGELKPLRRATNLGQREDRWRLILENCWCVLDGRKNDKLRLLPVAPRYAFKRKISALRRAILTHYQSAFQNRNTPYPFANAQLLTAMTFGEGGLSTPLPRQVSEEFRIAGLSHLLVASGAQIAFCAALLLGLGKLLGLRGGWLLALAVPPLLLYAAIAGGAPSIARATIIGILLAVAVLSGRDLDGLSLWSLALICSLVFDPLQLMSLSLQLSFGAAWGMIALAPLLQSRFKRVFGKSSFADLMAFSSGAQLGVLPVLLYHFGRVSLAGVGANLLGVPLAGILVATGIAGLILPLSWLNEFLTLGVASVASGFASLPGAQIEAPPVRLMWTLLSYGALAFVMFSLATRPAPEPDGKDFYGTLFSAVREEISRWWANKKTHSPRPQNILVLAIFIFTIWSGFRYFAPQNPLLKMTMLDVGQGESLVVVSPQGRVVLIDGGSDAQGLRSNVGPGVIVPYLQAMGVRKIDALVVTHADADHCNGLLAVLREIPVDLVLDGAPSDDQSAVEYQELKREISRRKIPIVAARAGQSLNLGAAKMRVLSPLPASSRMAGDNNNSAVLKLEYGATSFLLTGDIEKEAEEILARREGNLKCTVLKVAHHGSQTSSTPLFLKKADPQIALISCGRYNRFKHPAPGVLTGFHKEKIGVFRTDLDGAIEVFSDGKNCWVQTAR